MPEYGLLYFDHLCGEYRTLAHLITDTPEKQSLEEIQNKRKNGSLRWDDILTFALIVAKFQDMETLKGKVYTLRAKYQTLIAPPEYKEFLASKTFEVENGDESEKLLRSEYNFLISEFCLNYSFITGRERLRERLLSRGILLTLFFFLLAAVIGTFAYQRQNIILLNFSTLLIVVFAGATGAFVSVQQRIQRIHNQGDPIFNLSLLTHGWLSIFLSPFSGAIFAVILYLFFAGGLLTGKIFPNITTPRQPPDIEVTAQVEPTTSATEQSNPNANSSDSPSPIPTPNASSPVVTLVQSKTTYLTHFLKNTGPVSGTDYALLLIWSFIAGFAERFVPDSLMHLVGQGNKMMRHRANTSNAQK